MATANSIAGNYVVTASASGVTPDATFNLTNQITPTFSGLNNQTVNYGSTLTFTGTLEAVCRSRLAERSPLRSMASRVMRQLRRTDRSRLRSLDPMVW